MGQSRCCFVRFDEGRALFHLKICWLSSSWDQREARAANWPCNLDSHRCRSASMVVYIFSQQLLQRPCQADILHCWAAQSLQFAGMMALLSVSGPYWILTKAPVLSWIVHKPQSVRHLCARSKTMWFFGRHLTWSSSLKEYSPVKVLCGLKYY